MASMPEASARPPEAQAPSTRRCGLRASPGCAPARTAPRCPWRAKHSPAKLPTIPRSTSSGSTPASAMAPRTARRRWASMAGVPPPAELRVTLPDEVRVVLPDEGSAGSAEDVNGSRRLHAVPHHHTIGRPRHPFRLLLDRRRSGPRRRAAARCIHRLVRGIFPALPTGPGEAFTSRENGISYSRSRPALRDGLFIRASFGFQAPRRSPIEGVPPAESGVSPGRSREGSAGKAFRAPGMGGSWEWEGEELSRSPRWRSCRSPPEGSARGRRW